jgi:hypothetical protein
VEAAELASWTGLVEGTHPSTRGPAGQLPSSPSPRRGATSLTVADSGIGAGASPEESYRRRPLLRKIAQRSLGWSFRR